MSFIDIIRLLARFFHYIAGTAILLAFLVFYATKDGKKEYATHTLLNTGLISGYSIESNSNGRVDYAKTNNELENLINLATAYETNKELSAKLMAHFLIAKRDGQLGLLPDNLEHFEESLKHIDLNITQEDTEISLYEKIVAQRDADKYNEFYLITNSKNDFFGVEQLENITVVREGNSDMIRMEYTSIDPLLSQLTLELLTDIFMSKQKVIKKGQSDSVIEFFEEAVNKSAGRLKTAEDDLLQFRVNNKIINYYEQTRFISGNKEELDKQYQEELKILAGAKSALTKLELEISDKNVLPILQTKLAEHRTEISKYSAQLASLEISQDSLETDARVIQKRGISSKIDSLKTQLSGVTAELIYTNQTPEGVQTKDLLTQWLNQSITREVASAKIGIMEARQAEYEKIYDRFAPLGSTLKRLEREIDVAEREYLENLHSFNQARLHKYSMMMSSDIKVIDAPYYPIKPEKSKRMMMVILAFLVGAVLPTALVIGLELLDSTLKNPENATQQTGLKLGGILPKVKNNKKQLVDFESLNKQALNLFIQELRTHKKEEKQPQKVIVFSTNPGEGKSYLIDELQRYYDSFLSKKEQKEIKEFEFVELDPILHEPYSQEQLAEGDIHVLVARSNRKWTASDKHALKVYKKLAQQKPILFLNGVTTEVMEEVIGQIPKKRSWLRRTIKQLLTQGFKPATI